MISWKSKRRKKIRNSCSERSRRRQRRRRKRVVRKETTRSPNLIRILDADIKARDISNKVEDIKVVEDIKTKEVAVTKDTKEEEDSRVVAEATIRVAVSEEEAVAMEINITNKVVVIVALLQPIRLVSLIGTTIIIIIWTIRVMIRDHFTPIKDGIDN